MGYMTNIARTRAPPPAARLSTAPGNAERKVGSKALSDGCSRGPGALHARPRTRTGDLIGGVDSLHPCGGPGVLLQRRVRLFRSRLALEGGKRQWRVCCLPGFMAPTGWIVV